MSTELVMSTSGGGFGHGGVVLYGSPYLSTHLCPGAGDGGPRGLGEGRGSTMYRYVSMCVRGRSAWRERQREREREREREMKRDRETHRQTVIGA